MKIVKSIAEFKKLRSLNRNASVGFVPTMGAMHQGHLSLMKLVRKQSDVTVSSLFVNPTQFGPNEDYSKYPRTFDDDCDKMIQSGAVDILFAPDPVEIYPPGSFCTRVCIDTDVFLKDQPEAQRRPGHFDGVATVLCKLFNIVRPSDVFFGQKDALQCIVVKRLVEDLNFSPDIKVHIGPTIRESDGLAMSSRNRYLKPEDRTFAPVLFQALNQAYEYYLGHSEQTTCKELVMITTGALERAILPKQPDYSLEYVSLCDGDTGQVLSSADERVRSGAVLSAVINLNGTRLLDNIVIT